MKYAMLWNAAAPLRRGGLLPNVTVAGAAYYIIRPRSGRQESRHRFHLPSIATLNDLDRPLRLKVVA